MNGKKAKLFRRLAGVNKQTRQDVSYHGVEHTVRKKAIEHPFELNADGSPVILGHYQTASYALNQGPRLLVKILKKQYKRTMQSLQKNMLAA